MDKFKKRFADSMHTVVKVGVWAWFRGCEVQFPEIRMAPTYSQWKDYVDAGDLMINKKRCEVKHLNKEFTTAKTYPFDDIFVCARHSFDNAVPKPNYYMLVNKSETAMAIVDVKNHLDWWVQENVLDKYYGTVQDLYVTRKDQVKFTPLINVFEWNSNATREIMAFINSERAALIKTQLTS